MDKIIIIDLDMPDVQSFAKKLRDKNFYTEVYTYKVAKDILLNSKAIILLGEYGKEKMLAQLNEIDTPFLDLVDREAQKNDLENFLKKHVKKTWDISDFVEKSIEEIKEKVGDKKVLCALSGGVDSSVAALLVHKAVGDKLTCVFVDTGLMRKNEGKEVYEAFTKEFDMKILTIDAKDRFLSLLKGVKDPEEKRKIIGEEFIRTFEDVAKDISKVEYLVQGTIYPDIIESGAEDNKLIKSHHNVGGLPDVIDFEEIIEPLKKLFKDEVREVGRYLKIPDFLVDRQPFPGPGLAIRIIGDVTEEKLEILREADHIFTEEVKNAGLKIWQYFAILTDLRSVGMNKNNERTYYYTLALRAVGDMDVLSAKWYKMPLDILEKVSSRITNEVDNINRVVYDISSKPPATIEWE